MCFFLWGAFFLKSRFDKISQFITFYHVSNKGRFWSILTTQSWYSSTKSRRHAQARLILESNIDEFNEFRLLHFY